MKSPLEQKVLNAIAAGVNVNEMSVIFEEAKTVKNWAVVKVITEMDDGPNKPIAAQKDQILQSAIDNKAWQDVFDIETTFKKADYKPIIGPRPLSIYIVQLEDLMRNMMAPEGKDFRVVIEHGEQIFVFPNKERFNWTQIRENADFQHISLKQEDYLSYSNYLKTGPHPAGLSMTLDPDKENEYRAALYVDYQEKYKHLPENQRLPESQITLEEMEAINIYTGEFCSAMNSLLRGENVGDELTTNGGLKKIRAALIHSVMAISGLGKIPETLITDAYRGENMRELGEHTDLIKAAAEHGIFTLDGFVSSNRDQTSWFQDKPVQYHYTNLRGANIQPISQYESEEREFLIPPTKVQLSNYKYEENGGKGKHRFEVSPTDDLGYDVSLTQSIKFEQALQQLQGRVEQLKSKVPEGDDGIPKKKYEAASALFDSLRRYRRAHFIKKTMSYEEFEKKCTVAINKAENTLERHATSKGKFLSYLREVLHMDPKGQSLKAVEKFKNILQGYRAEIAETEDKNRSLV